MLLLSLEARLSSNETEGGGSGWEERWGGTERSRGKENGNLEVLYEKIIYFQQMEGKKY